MWRKSVPDNIRIQNEQLLYRFYYDNEEELRIEQYEKYHFRLFSKSGKIVDVWPVRKTYYQKGMNGSKHYKDVNELKKLL